MTDWTGAGFGTDPEGDARRRAELEPARVDPAALRAAHERVEDEVLRSLALPPERLAPPAALPAEGAHAVTSTEYGSSVAIVCACGRWECIVSGPSSAAWAGRDHARHVRDEEAGARGE